MTTASPGPGALAGWRVLELAEGPAAAFCGRVLADLGAEVLTVEPVGGSPRRVDRSEPGRGDPTFAYLHAGKGSVCVPGGPTGADDEGIIEKLAGLADVIVSDLDPARLRELLGPSPAGAAVCVRPFGGTGPRADQPATHLTIFHSSGESSTLPSGPGWEMFPDRAPIQLGSDIGWYDAGWNAALVSMAVLVDRLHGRVGQQADLSVQECIISSNRTRLNRFHNEGVCVGRERGRYGILGMLRCRDGWVQAVGMRDEHWDALVAAPGSESFRAAGFADAATRSADQEGLGRTLHEWCSGRPKAEVAAQLSGLGVPAGIFADPGDLLRSDQLAHRRFFSSVNSGDGHLVTLPGAPYRLSRTPARTGAVPGAGSHTSFSERSEAPSAPVAGTRYLEGIRVLDFTWAAAGPYATLLLGFLGADVVKVESPNRLDPARSGFIARYDGVDRSPIFNEINLNKASVQADLKDPAALAAIRAQLGSFDVVVDNFRPGVMDRLGLGPADLLASHPHMVVASSSANGATGPEAKGGGLASIFAASGGLSGQTGYPDGPPTEVGDPMDYRSGTALAAAIVAALLHRSMTGEGQHVDVSSREVTIASSPAAVLAHGAGESPEPRLGNRDRSMSPHDVYPCLEAGWVAVSVRHAADWVGLCRILERPEWGDPMTEVSARAARREEIDAAISEWSAGLTAHEAAGRLIAAGIPAAPVMSFADVAQDAHLEARHAFVDIEHPVLGSQRVMGAPWHLSDGPQEVRRAAPLLGADTAALLGPASSGLSPASS